MSSSWVPPALPAAPASQDRRSHPVSPTARAAAPESGVWTWTLGQAAADSEDWEFPGTSSRSGRSTSPHPGGGASRRPLPHRVLGPHHRCAEGSPGPSSGPVFDSWLSCPSGRPAILTRFCELPWWAGRRGAQVGLGAPRGSRGSSGHRLFSDGGKTVSRVGGRPSSLPRGGLCRPVERHVRLTPVSPEEGGGSVMGVSPPSRSPCLASRCFNFPGDLRVPVGCQVPVGHTTQWTSRCLRTGVWSRKPPSSGARSGTRAAVGGRALQPLGWGCGTESHLDSCAGSWTLK